MSTRQTGCGATVLYTAGEAEFFAQLPYPAHTVELLQWCELEPGHAGPHYALGQQSLEDLWWLRWDHTGRGNRDPLVLSPCPAEDAPNELGNTEPCVLFAGHPGNHSFTFDIGQQHQSSKRPPVLLARPAEWDQLSPLQQANHELLLAHGLTVQVYLQMTSLRQHEQRLGVQSVRHLAGQTSRPQPQLARVDATMPGLSAAVALGHLAVLPNPPYDPFCSSEFIADSVVISLTPTGRQLLIEVEPQVRD